MNRILSYMQLLPYITKIVQQTDSKGGEYKIFTELVKALPFSWTRFEQ